jgi:hypothetical protein
MVNMLQARKRECVSVQATTVLYVTESSRLKSKWKMWAKNWKTDKDIFSHLPLLQESTEKIPMILKNIYAWTVKQLISYSV